MLAVRASTPPQPIKKAGFIDKISDTSLFAELVKDKHKRKKALKEIMKKTDDAEALGNGCDSTDSRVIDLDTNSDSVEPVITCIVDEDVVVVEEKRNFRIVSDEQHRAPDVKQPDEDKLANGVNGPAAPLQTLQDITDIPMPEAAIDDHEVSKNGLFSLVSDSAPGKKAPFFCYLEIVN